MKPFVFFDLGGTLVYESARESRFRAFWHERNVELSEDEVARAFYKADRYFMEHRPSLWRSPSAALRREHLRWVVATLGLMDDAEGLSARPWDHWTTFPETEAVLRSLRESGISCGVITNWDYTARDTVARLGLGSFFSPFVVSAEAGCEKPDRRLFELALDQAGVPGGDAIYVGDDYWVDVEGAWGAGIQAILVDRHPEWSNRQFPCTTVTSPCALAHHLAQRSGEVLRRLA